MTDAAAEASADLIRQALPLAADALEASAADVVFADFEGETYGNWTATGTAFGDGPAAGTLPGQMGVSGFMGKRLVNSFTSAPPEPSARHSAWS